MAEWCLTHYWMTFFIALAIISGVGTIFYNLSVNYNNKMKVKLYEIELKNKEIK